MGAAGELRAAVAGLSIETQPVEFGLANYDLAGVLLEGEAPDDVLNEAAQAAARALLVFTPQELPDLFAGASERLGQAQWRAGRRKAAERTYAQTAGALGAVGHHALQARLLAGYARAAGEAAKPDDPFSVRQAVGVFDEAIAAARKADARGLLVSLLSGSGRLLAGNPASVDEALSRFDESAEVVDDAEVGVAMAVHANRAAAYGLREAGIGTRICKRLFPATTGPYICRAFRNIRWKLHSCTGPSGRPGRSGPAATARRTCGRPTVRCSRRLSCSQTTRTAADGRRCGMSGGWRRRNCRNEGFRGPRAQR